MTEDRLSRILAAAELPMAPAPEFAVDLLDDLREELGFPVPARPDRVHVRRRTTARRRRGRRLDLLLVAAILVTGGLGLSVALGAWRSPQPSPPLDVLAAIRAAGHLRVAIRPDHPQFTAAGQPAVGFDSDVAAALANRLGLTASIEIVPADVMLEPTAASTWDIALPSVATWKVGAGSFATSRPYYRWPRWVVVRGDSSVTDIAQLGSQPICAVSDDAGADWLRGTYGPGSTAGPITSSVTIRSTDADCLADLDSHAVGAVVTADLTAADLASRSGIRVLGSGPPPEPRAVAVHRSAAASLLTAVDDALDRLGRDGTLTSLSQNRFGGADLTRP